MALFQLSHTSPFFGFLALYEEIERAPLGRLMFIISPMSSRSPILFSPMGKLRARRSAQRDHQEIERGEEMETGPGKERVRRRSQKANLEPRKDEKRPTVLSKERESKKVGPLKAP